MDSESRKMLKYLLTPEKNPTGHMLFVYFYGPYCEYSGCSEAQAMACIRYLIDQGYVKIICDQNGKKVGFELEHRAYQKAAFTRAAIVSFLMKSVLVPIVVTILTMIVINLAKDALPPWLSRLLQ